MEADVGTGAVREILVVVGVAVGGLLLAVVAAFAPWYDVSAGPGGAEVVEMRAPAGPAVGDLATSPDAG
ncbi:hypothetical protein [Polymorphospora rubra]|uniref:Uncharacterized protein n=1 Tax=Polymorphospora rubra TaxID=338584 RepID=A0A810N429_9ACTN|nr:hypothetical protein [Polymorphospora rubra]BCJ66478.1 hypothetical protein Prubr_34990 [Polymorphospora rubra]